MKILHVIPSLSPTEGGPSRALPLVAEALSRRGIEVVTVTTDDSGPGKRDPQLCESPIETPHETRHHFPKQTEFYKFSLPLSHWVAAHIREFDAVHVHALFSHASVSAAIIARRAKVPYVIRPLGVLNDYGIQNRRRWLKKMSLGLREGPILRRAGAVHFTSHDEFEEAYRLGIPLRAEVIPIGIRFPNTQERTPDSAEPYALYLSRLDPKKNLESLLKAWSRIPDNKRGSWRLRIAGDGDETYVASLRKLAEELSIENHVDWLGQVDGAAKEQLLAEADLFVLPSFSENFGIAAAEAMGRGIPSLLTRGVAVGEEAGPHGACLLTGTDSESIRQSLLNAMQNPNLREETSRKGIAFARDRYSLNRMGESLENLYEQILAR